MRKTANILFVLSLICIFANTAESADTVEYPRYLPPARTRDEIIAEELRKEAYRVAPAIIVKFAEGSDEVEPGYKEVLSECAGYLEAHPDSTAIINGHSDSLGTPAANMRLSERRARKVKEILVEEFAIDGLRLKTVGWGGKRPAASNKTAAGRKKNRRVEAVIVSK